MPISLEGRTAIVTGSEDGLGRAIAQRFLEAGARVMLAETAEPPNGNGALSGDEDRQARFQYVPEDKLSIANLLAATLDRFDRIDILVNAARIPTGAEPFDDIDPVEFTASLGENVGAVLRLAQAVARRMAPPGDDPHDAAAMVNLTSILGARASGDRLVDAVNAAAIIQLTRTMAAALAPQAIRVNAVAVGGLLMPETLEAVREDEDVRERMVAAAPLGRLGEMEEAASAVLYLASGEAAYVTGQVIAVDGGRSVLDSAPI